jgi:hypothetical protein
MVMGLSGHHPNLVQTSPKQPAQRAILAQSFLADGQSALAVSNFLQLVLTELW